MTVTEPISTERPRGDPGTARRATGADSKRVTAIVAGEGADHEHVAVGEVDELHDAVHHRVAQGDQGVDEAQLQPVDDVLREQRGVLAMRLGQVTSTTGRQGDQDQEDPAHPGERGAPARDAGRAARPVCSCAVVRPGRSKGEGNRGVALSSVLRADDPLRVDDGLRTTILPPLTARMVADFTGLCWASKVILPGHAVEADLLHGDRDLVGVVRVRPP